MQILAKIIAKTRLTANLGEDLLCSEKIAAEFRGLMKTPFPPYPGNLNYSKAGRSPRK
jgi:hypothetical protein